MEKIFFPYFFSIFLYKKKSPYEVTVRVVSAEDIKKKMRKNRIISN
jgi:hypothetical protein